MMTVPQQLLRDFPMCNCRLNALEFTGWERLQDAANFKKRKDARNSGFGKIPARAGIYCIRVAGVGETDLNKITTRYKESDLYKVCYSRYEASKRFFDSCGLGDKWGWRWLVQHMDERLNKILRISITSEGELRCPILHIGCSKNLRRRLLELMRLEHQINHPLWALLYSGWNLELAWKLVFGDPKEKEYEREEEKLKRLYQGDHDGKLAPLMEE